MGREKEGREVAHGLCPEHCAGRCHGNGRSQASRKQRGLEGSLWAGKSGQIARQRTANLHPAAGKGAPQNSIALPESGLERPARPPPGHPGLLAAESRGGPGQA